MIDALLGAIAVAFEKSEIRICPATDFAPELLATEGVLAGKPLSKRRMADVVFGWRLRKNLDVLISADSSRKESGSNGP